MAAKGMSERRQPSQLRARATRERILDVAAELFGERGLADTSMNRIAAAAEVSVGTVYRYFPDRSVIADEVLDRLTASIEERVTQQVFGMSSRPVAEVMTNMLRAASDELVANARLVRAFAAGIPFYSSGIPELERRVRLLTKLLVIQILGPGDDHEYDVMTTVLINTGFAAALRAAALEVGEREREEAIAMTGRMVDAWAAAETAARRADSARFGSG
ncbi:TetR/AcrR family transcriptional regulator [Nocardia sp. NPDC003482]|uniref:TetR/AcrR family transcriptional regulator n=1 Tax=Nocardia sp. NPDC004068 TaxID=3364303 RepID=UPI00369C9FDC